MLPRQQCLSLYAAPFCTCALQYETCILINATLLTTALMTTVHRAKFSYTNYAGVFAVASGEPSPGERRHDTFSTHKATGKNKYRLPMNLNMAFNRPRAAKMGPARIEEAHFNDTNNNTDNTASGSSRSSALQALFSRPRAARMGPAHIEDGSCTNLNDDDTNDTDTDNTSNSVLQALGQRWRALLGAATVSSTGAAKRRRSSLKPFLSNAGDAPQSPTAAVVSQRSVRVSAQEYPRTRGAHTTSLRSLGSEQGFAALVPLSPVPAPVEAAAAVPAAAAVAPIVVDPSNTLHNVMVEGQITSRDLEKHLAPLLARLFIEEQRKLRAARDGATTATAAKPEPVDCYSSKNTVIVVSGPPGFNDHVDALLKALAVPTQMVLFLD
jgi:hypothetical protein